MINLIAFVAQLICVAAFIWLTVGSVACGIGAIISLFEKTSMARWINSGTPIVILGALATPIGQVPLAIVAHSIEWHSGPIMGVTNDVSAFPLVVALGPVILFWFIGVLPAIRTAWKETDRFCQSPLEKCLILLSTIVLALLPALSHR